MGMVGSGSCVFNRKTCLCRSGCKKFLVLDEGKIGDSRGDCRGEEGKGDSEVCEYADGNEHVLIIMNLLYNYFPP